MLKAFRSIALAIMSSAALLALVSSPAGAGAGPWVYVDVSVAQECYNLGNLNFDNYSNCDSSGDVCDYNLTYNNTSGRAVEVKIGIVQPPEHWSTPNGLSIDQSLKAGTFLKLAILHGPHKSHKPATPVSVNFTCINQGQLPACPPNRPNC